jgi:hypothetical protein
MPPSFGAVLPLGNGFFHPGDLRLLMLRRLSLDLGMVGLNPGLLLLLPSILDARLLAPSEILYATL